MKFIIIIGEITEELLVLAFLLCEGFNVENDYQNKLDELFSENSEKNIYLELELMSSNIKNSILYILSQIDKLEIDYELFGKHLMNRLKFCYSSMDIKLFAEKMYSLWNKLPRCIQHEEPFLILTYADDPLSWEDEKQTKELYEHMFNYYN